MKELKEFVKNDSWNLYMYYIIRLYYNYILDKFDKQVAEEAVQ